MAFPGVFRSFSVCLVLMLSIKSSVALPETGKWDFDMSPVSNKAERFGSHHKKCCRFVDVSHNYDDLQLRISKYAILTLYLSSRK